MTIPEPGQIVSKIDEMVSPAPEPENAVLTDETRVVRWTGPLFACALAAGRRGFPAAVGARPAQEAARA